MRLYMSSTAIGLALFAGAPAAHAQQVVTRQIVTPPLETVQTTETVRSVRPAHHVARHEVVTTRTVTRRVIPTTTVVAGTVPVPPPQPLYGEGMPAPAINNAAYSNATYNDAAYGPPLYDQVTPATSAPVGTTRVIDNGGMTATQPLFYHYVYEPDRILVIDPATGVAVQSIPR